MAVPNDNFGLVAVITEIDKYGEIVLKANGTGGSLINAFAAASDEGFVGGTPPATSGLSEFAGYEQPDPTPPDPDPTVNPISAAYDSNSSSDACTNREFGLVNTYYVDADSLNLYTATKLYSNNTNPLQFAASGYYVTDTFFGWRYWDSSTGTFTSDGSCGGGGFGP